MRLTPLLLILLCACTPKVEPPTEAPQKQSASVDVYADASDEAAGKAAAAVQVAKETLGEGKTKATAKELDVAQANLPRPTPADVAEARTRADKLDDATYAKALVDADRLQRQIDDLWAKVEAARAEDKAKADAQVAKMKMEFEEERKNKMVMMFAAAGVVSCLFGIGLIAFSTNKVSGVVAFVLGIVLGSVGVMWDSPYFLPSIGGAGFLITCVGVWWVMRSKAQGCPNTQNPPSDPPSPTP